MNIFSEVKEQLTTRQVAESYGLRIRKNGVACCPFHDDRHPSMKVDKNYHYDIVFDSWLFELSLERWIITGGAVYFNSISSIKYNCIRDFINGNKRKEFIFIWHECHLIINKLWSNRFDSESTFCNNSLDMGSSFSCVGTFICNTDKKIV